MSDHSDDLPAFLDRMLERARREAAEASPEERERMLEALTRAKPDEWYRSFDEVAQRTLDALSRQPRDALWWVQGAIERAEEQQAVAVDDGSRVEWGQVVATLKGLREVLL